MIIEYKIKNQASEKQCPHADFLLRVGSALCNICEYNKSTINNFFNSCVNCTCPDDKQLEDLPKINL